MQSTRDVDSEPIGDTLQLGPSTTRWGQTYMYTDRTVYKILVHQGEGANRAVCSGPAWVTATGEPQAEWCYAEAERTMAGGQVHTGDQVIAFDP